MSVLIIELDSCKGGSCRSSGKFKPSELGFGDQQEFRFDGDMGLDIRLNTTDRFTYYAHGHVLYRAHTECRRCLKPIVRERDAELRGVFAFPEGLEKMDLSEEERELEGVYPLVRDQKEIDLTEFVREGVALDFPRFLECSEQCKGLCPTCGTDLNEETCDCRSDMVDIRWSTLRKLKDKS